MFRDVMTNRDRENVEAGGGNMPTLPHRLHILTWVDCHTPLATPLSKVKTKIAFPVNDDS